MAYLSILTSFVPELCLWRRPPVKILWRLFFIKGKPLQPIYRDFFYKFYWHTGSYCLSMSQAEMMIQGVPAPLSTNSLSTILGIVRFQIVLNSIKFLDIVQFLTDSLQFSTYLLNRISSFTSLSIFWIFFESLLFSKCNLNFEYWLEKYSTLV